MEEPNQLRALSEMTPEQLEFNKKMVAFLRFLGLSDEEIALLPKIARQWDGLVGDCNRNFSALSSRLEAAEAQIQRLTDSANSGEGENGKKTVMEELSEAPKGLNPYGR